MVSDFTYSQTYWIQDSLSTGNLVHETKLQIINDIQKEKLKDAWHLLSCLEKGCEVCFPDEGVKYESDVDDYLYDSDIADDNDTSESNNDTDDDNQEVEIEID